MRRRQFMIRVPTIYPCSDSFQGTRPPGGNRSARVGDHACLIGQAPGRCVRGFLARNVGFRCRTKSGHGGNIGDIMGYRHLSPETVQDNRVNNQRRNAKSRRREKASPRFQVEYRLAVRMADRSQKRPAMRMRARCLAGPWAPGRLGVELLLVHPIAQRDDPDATGAAFGHKGSSIWHHCTAGARTLPYCLPNAAVTRAPSTHPT
jgi:hypothetical protein